MSVVELDRTTLRIAGRTVLSDASLSIKAGEFIGVLGPNGAGKTTLMRAILGLLQPSQGSVRVFNAPPKRGNPNIGYLPQFRTALPGMRVRGVDFVGSSLHGQRWGLPHLSKYDRQKIYETLNMLGVRELAQRTLNEMSGGERQMLLLAQALMENPKLLLLDEPLISLDARHQEIAISSVQRLCREHDVTVLFAAHELNQLLGVLDRVLYLGNGQAAIGSVDEVLNVEVLSRLYGAEIEVVRAQGHIFVMSNGREMERVHHTHDHDGHEHYD